MRNHPYITNKNFIVLNYLFWFDIIIFQFSLLHNFLTSISLSVCLELQCRIQWLVTLCMLQTFRGKQLSSGLKTNAPRTEFQNSAFLTSTLLMKLLEDFIFWVVFTYATSYVKNEKSYNHMKKNVSPIRNYGGDYMFGWNTDNNILQKESVEMSNTLGIIQCLYTFFSH